MISAALPAIMIKGVDHALPFAPERLVDYGEKCEQMVISCALNFILSS